MYSMSGFRKPPAGEGSFDKRRGTVLIYTNSFTAVEVDQLRGALNNPLNIESTRCSAGGQGKGEQYLIRIPRRELAKVQELVKPFIPSMMRYRAGL
jgi:hypothetical protein